MLINRIHTNSIISAYRNTANQNLLASDNAKNLGLKNEQTVEKNESRYDFDGKLKDEYKLSGASKTEKSDKTEEASAFGGKQSKAAEHAKNKHDGFEKDCPACQCETCKKRRYKDESDDSGVSFQTATRISPEAASSRVRGHEMEHVRRERMKADNEGKKIVSQTVQIKTDICEECGKIYVAGGLTRTRTRTDMTDFHKTFMLGFDESDAKTG